VDPALGLVPARRERRPVTAGRRDVVVRGFHPSDLPAMYEVCLRTGDSGRDATHLYQDPHLLGHVYCGPYPVADPGLAFVAVDELGVAGYVVATADARSFSVWRRSVWYPRLRETYPRGSRPPGPEADRIAEIWSDSDPDGEVLADYPAELHIDLLPRLQGRGLGRALTERVWSALRSRGAGGVHLGVGSGNGSARSFYLAMGYTEHAVHDWGSTMVKDLS